MELLTDGIEFEDGLPQYVVSSPSMSDAPMSDSPSRSTSPANFESPTGDDDSDDDIIFCEEIPAKGATQRRNEDEMASGGDEDNNNDRKFTSLNSSAPVKSEGSAPSTLEVSAHFALEAAPEPCT